MFDGILNNRKEWKALPEAYEAKLKAAEEAAKATQEAAAAKHGLNSDLSVKTTTFEHFSILFSWVIFFLSFSYIS